MEAQTRAGVRGFLPVWDQLGLEQGRLVRKPLCNMDVALKHLSGPSRSDGPRCSTDVT